MVLSDLADISDTRLGDTLGEAFLLGKLGSAVTLFVDFWTDIPILEVAGPTAALVGDARAFYTF